MTGTDVTEFASVETGVLELGEYRGIPLNAMIISVDDALIDKRVEELFDMVAKRENIVGTIAPGDSVVLSYKALVGGKPFLGSSAKCSLTVGAGAFVKGFEDRIIGREVGEKFHFVISFPEAHIREDLRGKPIRFSVEIHEAVRKLARIVDDAYVREVSEFDSLEELRLAIGEQLKAESEAEVMRYYERQVAEHLIASSTVSVTADILASYLLRELDAERIVDVPQDPADVAEILSSIPENQLDEVKAELAVEMILDKIAAEEDLTIDEDEIAAELALVADSIGMSVQAVFEDYFAQGYEDAMTAYLLRNKAMQLVLENAVFERNNSEGYEQGGCAK